MHTVWDTAQQQWIKYKMNDETRILKIRIIIKNKVKKKLKIGWIAVSINKD